MNYIKNNVIAYTVDRVVNTGLYISVQNGQVVVKAPWYVSKEKIQEVVEEKKKWIAEKLREYQDKDIAKREYINKQKIMIFGEQFTLKTVYKNIKLPRLEVKDTEVIIEIPNKYKKMDNSDVIRILIERMYDRIALEEIDNIMEKTRILLQMAPEDYEIKRNENILASCIDNKIIIINPDIVRYNKEIIEYVILHEFCHLKYKNHTKSFYDMIKAYMPNYSKYTEIITNYKY